MSLILYFTRTVIGYSSGSNHFSELFPHINVIETALWIWVVIVLLESTCNTILLTHLVRATDVKLGVVHAFLLTCRTLGGGLLGKFLNQA